MFWWAARCISKVENRRAGRFPKAAVTHRLLACLLLAASGWGHTADIVKGAELYRQHCASCHGNQGRPVMVGATDFSQPTALLKPDMNLLQSIRAGRGAMPAYQGLLRDRDLLDIVAHLRTFR
jgi:cytochrome c6